MEEKVNRGGARPGAGRPRTNREYTTIALAPDVKAWIDAQPGSRADVIDRLVRQQMAADDSQ
jgi:hypothetical protein